MPGSPGARGPTGLSPEQLRRACDASKFDFETTASLEPLSEIIGQPRAVAAVELALDVPHRGFNLFLAGPPGCGKRTFALEHLKASAREKPVPPDWAYVNAFDDPHQPRALSLPPGRGRKLRADMRKLIEELQHGIPAAFESEEYRTRRRVIEQQLEDAQEETFETIQGKAKDQGLSIVRTPVGLVFAPTRDGEVLPPEEFRKLPKNEQEELERRVQALQEELRRSLQGVQRLGRKVREELKQLDREVTEFAVGHLLEALRAEHADLTEVVSYLEDVEKDVVDHAQDFLKAQSEGMDHPVIRGGNGPPAFRRYQVNLVVDSADAEGAPVIVEDNPTHANLVGRVEHVPEMGALVTDFNLIAPGALHAANGGYLVLEARRLLGRPNAWEALKEALRTERIRIESLGEALSLISTVSLKPQPIPLDAKIVLIGDRLIYYLLCELDPEFGELFKVIGDFGESMERTEENEALLARLVAAMTRRDDLRPLDANAVMRVIERAARLAGDGLRLSTRFERIADLIREADHWAGKSGRRNVTAEDVQAAIDARDYRADRVRERLQEQVLRGQVLIDCEGEAVGQVNGLSVLQMGNFAFGKPSRITATVRLGRGDVVDIEREVELGGPIHSKGVLILSSYLSARFASDTPLSLSASLVFEQSYGGVDGDSASSAELHALLSAVSGIPIKQSLAVTGSVNQHGQVQAIGGVNEKIEGFFDLCAARGLTGEQGVLIPASNVEHLMLRDDVIAAVREGRFHVHPVETVDQGIELLTGRPAGSEGEDGTFPEDSVNGKVRRRLEELARKRRELLKRREDDERG